MPTPARHFGALASALLALATLIGALASHALKPRLSADHYAVLQTAVNYQFFHALGLLALAALLQRQALRGLRAACTLLFCGVLLFSGSLYLILAGAPRAFGVLTPLGGLALIAGWALAAYALMFAPTPSEPGADPR